MMLCEFVGLGWIGLFVAFEVGFCFGFLVRPWWAMRLGVGWIWLWVLFGLWVFVLFCFLFCLG